MCLLFETIQIKNGRAMHLEWHLKRIARSLEYLYGCTTPFVPPGSADRNGISPLLIEQELEMFSLPKEIHKCRLIYTMGIVDIQFIPYTPQKAETFQLLYCDDIDYSHKFLDRADLEELFGKRGQADDIIIVKNSCMTDSSIANLVFFDGKKHVTPDTPLLPGTCRARLLAEGKIFERRITPSDLKHYVSFCTINAMSDDDFEEMIDIANILK
jgi:4-amino-4-deoxychorismate lyase